MESRSGIDRREFLRTAGLLGAATTALPWGMEALARSGFGPAELEAIAARTTLSQTIVKGSKLSEGSVGAYHALTWGPGESHQVRDELAAPKEGRGSRQRSLLNFVHFTDIHIIDAQSPARVEFLDRFADPGRGCESVPFSSAYRPQETLTLHILEAMIRQIRKIRRSPITGKELDLVVCTGDNIDNEQFNELRWFIDAMDGGSRISSNSGGKEYEGVQSAEWNDPEYWHPDPSVDDKYKQQFGFPSYEQLLQKAVKPFHARGVDLPWYQTFGNHDGLMQGNVGSNAIFDAVAVGSAKPAELMSGINPCDAFETFRANPSAFAAAPARQVTADADRRPVNRTEYIEEMFKTTGTPRGHGFKKSNRKDGLAYWYSDDRPGFRFIGLDTVNPGGYSEGSIGAAQLAWLEERLMETSGRYLDPSGEVVTQNVEDRLIILFSHHGIRSLNNPNSAPDPIDPAENDLPRVMGDEVEALVHRFPNVIAWVNGHTHENVVIPRVRADGSGGFWDIGTAAHVDWACQSRLIEVLDNRDGTLSIACTMVDHAGHPKPGGQGRVLNLASVARELAANDFQYGFGSKGRGTELDRNVELVIATPFS